VAELAGDVADLLTELRLTERAADRSTERTAETAEDVPEQTLWHEMLLATHIGPDVLLSATEAAKLLRTGREGQHMAELAGEAAELLTELRLAECTANRPTERPAKAAENVPEQALRRELLLAADMGPNLLLPAAEGTELLRTGREGQHVTELTGPAADLLTELRLAERAADHAAEGTAEAAEDVPEQALRHHLWSAGHGQSGIERLSEV
jgi:molybdenum-dependent DNA-binding transcriptional regulator ModE